MRFQCSHCKQIVAIDDTERGQPVGCGHCGGVTIVPRTRFSPNAVINDFVIQKVLGHGGMGTVYLAHQISLDRPVALKVLMEQFSRNSEFIVDFVKEARAAARLNHPNIVQSFAVGEDDGIYYFAMEYVEGSTLKELMDEAGVLPMERAVSIIQQIAAALEFAWKNQKLVHRDIKPDNIMLTPRGVAKLADLGLARMASELMEDDDEEVMGTPQYICPEQLLGQAMDVRGDIYSLGATLYHALTGRFPFEGNSAAEIARHHLQAELTPPGKWNPELPKSVSYVVCRMMARNVEDRYQDAASLERDLGKVLRGEAPAGMKGKAGGRKKGKSFTAKNASTRPSGRHRRVQTGVHRAHAKRATGKHRRVQTGRLQRVSKARSGEAEKAAQQLAPTMVTEAADDMVAETPAMAATPTEGGQTIKKKPKVKFKRRGTTKSRATTYGTTATTSSPGSAAAAGPPKSHAGLIFLLVLVALGALAGGGFLLHLYQKYTPDRVEDAEQMYLNLETLAPNERQDYNKIKPYMGRVEDYKNDPDTLNLVAGLAHKFVQDYKNSLFSRPADQIDFAELYGAPSFFDKHLTQVGSPLAGTVVQTLQNYDEMYVRHLREEMRKEEEKKISEYRYEQRLTRMEERVVAYVAERKASLEGKIAEFEESLQRKQELFQKEKDERFEQALELCNGLDFELATKRIGDWIANTDRYGPSIEIEVNAIVQKSEDELGKVFRFAVSNDLDVEIEKVEDRFRAEIESSQIEALKPDIPTFLDKEKQIFLERANWLTQLKDSIELAGEFYALVSNTQKKLESTTVRIPRLLDPKELMRIEISSLDRAKARLNLKKWSTDGGWIVTDQIEMTYDELPFSEFVKLAKLSWKTRDPNGFNLRRGAYLYWQLQLNAAQQDLRDNNSNPAVQFMLDELERAKKYVVPKMVAWNLARVIKLADREDESGRSLEHAKSLYTKLKKAFGATPEFQEKEAELSDALSKVKQ